jgi:hypothetical protein
VKNPYQHGTLAELLSRLSRYSPTLFMLIAVLSALGLALEGRLLYEGSRPLGDYWVHLNSFSTVPLDLWLVSGLYICHAIISTFYACVVKACHRVIDAEFVG